MASYYGTLTEAINDCLEHGYDSPRRVGYWRERLRDAASASFAPQKVLEGHLHKALHAVYHREVERGASQRNHIGLEPFAFERVKPSLRAELERRLLASADLIEHTRDAAMEGTLRRFSGWASGLPRGGVALRARAVYKASIRKPLLGLGLAERRVVVDQSARLVAAFNDIVAHESGAIAAQWRSKWRAPGYNYRPDHKERDGHIYVVRGCDAHRDRLINRGAGYVESISRPTEEPNCKCSYTYFYNLQDLPLEIITRKGAKALEA